MEFGPIVHHVLKKRRTAGVGYSPGSLAYPSGLTLTFQRKKKRGRTRGKTCPLDSSRESVGRTPHDRRPSHDDSQEKTHDSQEKKQQPLRA